MITEDEITKIFCMADDFCKTYDKFIRTNGLGPSEREGNENITGLQNCLIRKSSPS